MQTHLPNSTLLPRLLTQTAYRLTQSSCSEEVLISSLQSLVKLFTPSVSLDWLTYIQEDPVTWIPAIAYLETSLLQCTLHRAQQIRLLSLDVLDAVVIMLSKESALMAASMPGLVGALVKLVVSDHLSQNGTNVSAVGTTPHRVICRGLQVIARIIEVALHSNEDLNFSTPEWVIKAAENEPRLSFTKRNKEWLCSTNDKLVQVFTLLQRLHQHGHVKVRQSLQEFCLQLINSLSIKLSEEALSVLSDTIILTRTDMTLTLDLPCHVRLISLAESLVHLKSASQVSHSLLLSSGYVHVWKEKSWPKELISSYFQGLICLLEAACVDNQQHQLVQIESVSYPVALISETLSASFSWEAVQKWCQSLVQFGDYVSFIDQFHSLKTFSASHLLLLFAVVNAVEEHHLPCLTLDALQKRIVDSYESHNETDRRSLLCLALMQSTSSILIYHRQKSTALVMKRVLFPLLAALSRPPLQRMAELCLSRLARDVGFSNDSSSALVQLIVDHRDYLVDRALLSLSSEQRSTAVHVLHGLVTVGGSQCLDVLYPVVPRMIALAEQVDESMAANVNVVLAEQIALWMRHVSKVLKEWSGASERKKVEKKSISEHVEHFIQRRQLKQQELDDFEMATEQEQQEQDVSEIIDTTPLTLIQSFAQQIMDLSVTAATHSTLKRRLISLETVSDAMAVLSKERQPLVHQYLHKHWRIIIQGLGARNGNASLQEPSSENAVTERLLQQLDRDISMESLAMERASIQCLISICYCTDETFMVQRFSRDVFPLVQLRLRQLKTTDNLISRRRAVQFILLLVVACREMSLTRVTLDSFWFVVRTWSRLEDRDMALAQLESIDPLIESTDVELAQSDDTFAASRLLMDALIHCDADLAWFRLKT